MMIANNSEQAEIIIEQATAQDIEPIRRMQAKSWQDTYLNDDLGITDEWLANETASWFTDERHKDSREWLGAIFVDKDQFYRVARCNGVIKGLIHLSTRADGERRLEGLYVDKSMHGTGLAQQLMDQAASFMGNHEIELEVVSYNERAKAFYRKYGFIATDKKNELYQNKIEATTMIRPKNQDMEAGINKGEQQ